MSSVVQRYVRSRLSTIYIALSLGLLITLSSLGLAACASNLPGSTSTPSAQIKPSAQEQHCGKIQTGPNGALLSATIAKQAANCFWQAFQHCRAASLIFASSGSDAAIIRTFTVEKKGDQCSISDAVQDVMGANSPSPVKIYRCTGVVQQSDSLHFTSCGEDGDVFVHTVVAQ